MARGNSTEIKLDEKCHHFFKQKMISNYIFDFTFFYKQPVDKQLAFK